MDTYNIHYNTLKVCKIYSYSDSRKFVKTRIVHLLLLLLSSSVPSAYRETGVSNRSNSFTKIIYTGAYMILDVQNLHTFSQRVCNLTSVSFRRHFLVFSRAEHVKLVLLPWSRCRCFERSVVRLRCSFVSVSLND